MMFYVFNVAGKKISSINHLPNFEDLATRNERAIEVNEEQAVKFDAGATIDENNNLVEHEKPLEESRLEYIAAAKAYRDSQEVKAITYKGNDYDYDVKARERLRVARQALTDSSAESINWTTAGDTDVTLTVADFAAINSLAATRSNDLHVSYRATKAKLEAATTIEEINNI